ncbi:MAG: glycosyltransferase [Bacteroidales bacterium]|nr:glycosyltransferase [Bacteroidales bacterium]
MSPLVSVILPNYNYARYLPERIESILNQEFQDFELIILDDASTDNSVDILQTYSKHPKVSHFVINQSNTGSPFAQWKKGLELARGKYIWIAEADDSSTPLFLKKCVETMEANQDVVLCFTGCTVVNQNNEVIQRDYTIWKGKRMEKRIGDIVVHDGAEYIVHNMYWGCYVYNASATLFRRSYVTANMLEESAKMRNSGDWLFWTKLMGKGKVAEIYEVLNVLRRHDNNVTENGYKSGNICFEDIEVLKYIEDKYLVGAYRRIIRHGTFIKHIKRSDYPEELKAKILATFYNRLGASKNEYKLERIHKILYNVIPGLMSMRRDRL